MLEVKHSNSLDARSCIGSLVDLDSADQLRNPGCLTHGPVVRGVGYGVDLYIEMMGECVGLEM